MFNVNHIAISVVDSKRSIDFYKKFGFENYKSWEADDSSIDMLRLNNVVLEIFCYKDYKNLPETAKSTATDLPIVGVKHLALGVTDIEIGKKFVIKNELCSNIEIKVGRLGKPYFFITAPDGIQIEIIEE